MQSQATCPVSYRVGACRKVLDLGLRVSGLGFRAQEYGFGTIQGLRLFALLHRDAAPVK